MMHPLAKLTLVAGISALSVMLDNTMALAMLLLFCLILLLLKSASGSAQPFPFKSFLKLLPVIFSVFVLQLLFNRKGNTIIQFGWFSFTDIGFNTAVQVALRLAVLLLSGAWLWGMPSREVLRAFRSLGVPETFSILLMLTLSFLPELSAQVKNKLTLLRLRGLAAGRFAFIKKLKLYVNILLPVLGWTLKDLQLKAVALDLKGFRNGRRHTRFRQGRLRVWDYLVILLTTALAVALPLLLQS